jgi:hypothetical protein
MPVRFAAGRNRPVPLLALPPSTAPDLEETAVTTLAAPPRTTARTIPIGAAILAFGCVLLAYFDFFVTTSNGKYTYAADYLYAMDIFPFVVGLGLIVAGICARQGGRGRTGAIILAVGLAGLAVDCVAAMIAGNDQALGPLYPIGALVSFAGMVVLTVASIRARVLPWWTTPLLTITWIVGGVVGDDGPLGFKGSALLLAAAGIAVAAATARPTASN